VERFVRKAWLVPVFAAVGFLHVPIAGAGQDPPLPVLILHVITQAGIPDAVLDSALEHSRRMYAQAGIETVGVRGSDWPANTSSCGLRITISVVADGSALRLNRNGSVLGMAMGEANQDSRWAYVFYDGVREHLVGLRHRWPGPVESLAPLILAQVIAHEAGHLLLPHRRHATSGVMRERIDIDSTKAANNGTLWFRGEEARQMRSSINERAHCEPESGREAGDVGR
jgi:hypothetical protein